MMCVRHLITNPCKTSKNSHDTTPSTTSSTLIYRARAATPKAAATKPACPTLVGTAPATDEAAETAPPVALDNTLDKRLLPVAVPEFVTIPELPVREVPDRVPEDPDDDPDVDMEEDPVIVIDDDPELVLPRIEEASDRREEAIEDSRDEVRLLMMPPFEVVCV